MTHLVVWREKEGNALRTYADTGNKEALTFEKEETPLRFVDASELESLVSSRAPFEKVRIAPEVARTVLGWDV